MKVALNIELSEKVKLDEQLVDVIDLCQGANEKMDSRAMQVTFGAAAVRASVQDAVIKRGILKKQEESFEWLCCIADNAITAEIIESGVKKFLKHFRREKKEAYQRLVRTKEQLELQYKSMLAIIDNFCRQVTKQTKDHTTRELLVSQGFSNYLVDLNSGHLSKKTGILQNDFSALDKEFEVEHTLRRAERNCKQTVVNRAHSLQTLEEVKDDLVKQVTESFQYLSTEVMSEVFAHRDADVGQYLTDINKVLRKVVQISCNTRRKTHTENTKKRSNFYHFEDECLVEIGSLLANLRFEMDDAWRREHLNGVRINLAAQTRLEDMISKNEKKLKLAYNELSCFLEGERSNVHWVDVGAENLAEGNMQMLEKLHNLRVASHYKWIVTIKKTLPTVCNLFDNAVNKVTGGGEDEDGTPIPVIDCESEEFQELFVSLSNSCDDVQCVLLEEHSSRAEQEDALIEGEFSGMRISVENFWKDNIITMNEVLSSEVRLFLKRHDEYRAYVSDYNTLNEIEMYVFEQASSHRLDMFWNETNQKNNVFATELKYTLNKIIRGIEKVYSEKNDLNDSEKVESIGKLNEEDVLNISARMRVELGGSEHETPVPKLRGVLLIVVQPFHASAYDECLFYLLFFNSQA